MKYRMTITITLLVALALQMALTGCAASTRATVDEAIVPEMPPYDGPKAKVAVGKFDWDVGSAGAGMTWETPQGTYTWTATAHNEHMGGLQEMLMTSLMESNRYRVLEGEGLETLKNEIALGEQGYTKEETSVKKGGWDAADLVVNASVTEWEPDASGRSVGGGGIFGRTLGGLRVGKKKSKMAMHIRVVDPRTREVLVSKGVRGEASSWNFTGGAGTWLGGAALGGVLSQYENTPMGAAISKCIAEAVRIVSQQVPKEYFKY